MNRRPLHIRVTHYKTLCGLDRSKFMATAFDAIHVWYYHHNSQSYAGVTFCEKCEKDPRLPLYLLDNTDL